MMRQKILARKFHKHHLTDIFFELDDPHAVQLPRWVRDISRYQPAADERVETKTRSKKNVDGRLLRNPCLFCDSNGCSRTCSAATAEIGILLCGDIHSHVRPIVRQTISRACSEHGDEPRRVQREKPDTRTVQSDDIRSKIHFRKDKPEGMRKQRR